MWYYLDHIKSINISDENRHQVDSLASYKEESDFRILAGILMYRKLR